MVTAQADRHHPREEVANAIRCLHSASTTLEDVHGDALAHAPLYLRPRSDFDPDSPAFLKELEQLYLIPWETAHAIRFCAKDDQLRKALRAFAPSVRRHLLMQISALHFLVASVVHPYLYTASALQNYRLALFSLVEDSELMEMVPTHLRAVYRGQIGTAAALTHDFVVEVFVRGSPHSYDVSREMKHLASLATDHLRSFTQRHLQAAASASTIPELSDDHAISAAYRVVTTDQGHQVIEETFDPSAESATGWTYQWFNPKSLLSVKDEKGQLTGQNAQLSGWQLYAATHADRP